MEAIAVGAKPGPDAAIEGSGAAEAEPALLAGRRAFAAMELHDLFGHRVGGWSTWQGVRDAVQRQALGCMPVGNELVKWQA